MVWILWSGSIMLFFLKFQLQLISEYYGLDNGLFIHANGGQGLFGLTNMVGLEPPVRDLGRSGQYLSWVADLILCIHLNRFTKISSKSFLQYDRIDQQNSVFNLF